MTQSGHLSVTAPRGRSQRSRKNQARWKDVTGDDSESFAFKLNSNTRRGSRVTSCTRLAQGHRLQLNIWPWNSLGWARWKVCDLEGQSFLLCPVFVNHIKSLLQLAPWFQSWRVRQSIHLSRGPAVRSVTCWSVGQRPGPDRANRKMTVPAHHFRHGGANWPAVEEQAGQLWDGDETELSRRLWACWENAFHYLVLSATVHWQDILPEIHFTLLKNSNSAK